MWLVGVAGATLRNILVPTATSRRRSTVLPPEAKPRRYGRLAAMLVPVVVPLALGGLWLSADPAESTRLRVRAQFQRPSSLPSPASNVLSSARIELGRRLFNETRLSADNSLSCQTCHNPAQGFADGQKSSKGVTRVPLRVHTPTLFNLAWSNVLFWDGRVPSLEAQVRLPIENPDEMGLKIDVAVSRLQQDQGYIAAFAAAFPEAPEITPLSLSKAMAAYQRTLVSPMTRFDNWIAGETQALSASEKNGFLLFLGKAQCVSCHSGWSFTDYAFHDIGLATDRRGRGHVIGRAALEHAFKTPSLRELTWSAPYMHTGGLATLEDVVRHYEKGGVNRATRSPDLPRSLQFSDSERRDLVAFLKSLSSDTPYQPAAAPVIARGTIEPTSASKLPRVGQRDKSFTPKQVSIKAGDSVLVVNDDTQPHNVFVSDPRLNFDSGWQEPGSQTVVPFLLPGDFEIFCGIHPNMRLRVEVAPNTQRN